MKHSFFILSFLMFSFLQAQDCIYLAYESFDTPEQPLEGSHSGQTFSNAWYVQNNDNTAEGFRIDNETPLQFGDIQTEGNYVIGGYEYLTAGRNLYVDPVGFFGPYLNDNGMIGAAGTDIWVSALLRKEENNDQSIALSLHNDQLAWCQNCASSSIGLGYYGDASNENGERFWSLNINGTVHLSNQTVEIGETAFLAMHITFGTETMVDFFLNPTETGFQTPAANYMTTTNTLVEFQSMALYLGSNIDNGTADEIRIGSSWACVSPDSEVAVNLPPTADIQLTPNMTGVGENIFHNGTNSSDPESELSELTFEWLLPNGSTVSNQSFTDVYTFPGELDVALRVTDFHGAQNTAFSTVTVLDENGTFACLSSLTLLQQANCESQTGGSLQVNSDSDVALTLEDASGNTLAMTGWQQYDDLSPGNYTLLVTGNNACSDEYDLVIPVDSSSCAGWQPEPCFEQFGMNLTGFADWEKERPMRNLFKHIRRDIPTFSDNTAPWDLNIGGYLDLDENGYPMQIPQDVIVPQQNGSDLVYEDVKIHLVLSANAAGAEAGNLQAERTYVFLYDGIVEMTLFGVAQIISQTPGRIEFTTPAEGVLDNIVIDVHASQMGDHLRNIRLLRIEDEFTDLNATPFYQGFLDKIEPFTSLRFMDWGSTNGNPISVWEDRTPIDFRTYGAINGAPYEVMIELANTMQKDVWICVPHLADTNYIQQMARLFRDGLDENLTIYLEYSNEVWNWIFPQAHYNIETAPANLNYGRAYAEKAKTTFTLWQGEFGEQSDRLQRVLGLQLTHNWLNEQILSHLNQDDWDYGSPTWYFGLGGNPALNGSSTPEEVVAYATQNFRNSMPSRRQDYRNIKLYGKGIIEYEGGQHFTNLNQEPWTQAIMDAQNLPEMYELYTEVIDSLQVMGSDMPMAFALAREVNNIYNFGHMDDIDIEGPYSETAVKYQALLENICETPNSTDDFGINNTESSLEVFPNPIRLGERLYQISEKPVVAIEIYNITGQRIAQSAVENFDEFKNFIIPSGWTTGLYLVRFTLETGKTVTRKVVIID